MSGPDLMVGGVPRMGFSGANWSDDGLIAIVLRATNTVLRAL